MIELCFGFVLVCIIPLVIFGFIFGVLGQVAGIILAGFGTRK